MNATALATGREVALRLHFAVKVGRQQIPITEAEARAVETVAIWPNFSVVRDGASIVARINRAILPGARVAPKTALRRRYQVVTVKESPCQKCAGLGSFTKDKRPTSERLEKVVIDGHAGLLPTRVCGTCWGFGSYTVAEVRDRRGKVVAIPTMKLMARAS